MKRVLALSLLVVLAACGSDSPTSLRINVVGAFQLKTANGAPLPYTVNQSGGTKTELTAETLTLNADNTFSDLYSFRITSGATVTNTQTGSIGFYSTTNGLVNFTTTSGGSATFAGSVSGNTLTIQGTATFVYQR